jgi:hypothetical protein
MRKGTRRFFVLGAARTRRTAGLIFFSHHLPPESRVVSPLTYQNQFNRGDFHA